MSEIYLPRILYNAERTFSENELLTSESKLLVIILAEPGAGKSELLKSLARQLNTCALTANVAQYSPLISTNSSSLVIDALDELVKIDKSNIYQLLGKLASSSPTKIILSSRASEWEESYTKQCESFFGKKPLVVHLQPFTEIEQEKLFDIYYPDKSFVSFQQEVSKLELSELLPNPQFLEMFANAFAESGGKFANKDDIFSLSIQNACRELNPTVSSSNTLPLEKKQILAEELFAKLLLSGAEGVSISDGNANTLYPYVNAIMPNHQCVAEILTTKLFKPCDKADHHQPVHRIIAEYCAGKYLAKRVSSTEKMFSLNQLLAIIAPNSTVRDELRGLIGWFATFSDEQTQHKLIELDPYAVMANGNPSSLQPSSKKRLLQRLAEVAKTDPFFNRGDYWRDLSVDGLFTEDNIDEIKAIIVDKTNERLQQLLLKLLKSSKITSQLISELKNLALDKETKSYTRKLAYRCLIEVTEDTNHLNSLIQESSPTSLFMVSEFLTKKGISSISLQELLHYLKQCLSLYPKSHKDKWDKDMRWQKKYFIGQLIKLFDLQTVVFLLDKLTKDLRCSCGKQQYECECRYGISKVVGRLLDQYFTLKNAPYEPQQIWGWIQNLYFPDNPIKEDCSSIKVLQGNDELRQGIIKLVFEQETDQETIRNIKHNKFDWQVHNGLRFLSQDYEYILNLAFQNGNTGLWESFIDSHPIYNPPKDPHCLRQLARQQANEKPEFMCIWAKKNRKYKRSRKSENFRVRNSRRKKRWNKKQRNIKEKNLTFFKENRKLIERGEHWSVLAMASNYYLNSPKDIKEFFDDNQLVNKALENCQHFIQPHILSLEKLAQAQIDGVTYEVEQILFASCLRIFRKTGHLEQLSKKSLIATRVDRVPALKVEQEERKALEAEIDRIIFPSVVEIEDFLRSYIEPILSVDNGQIVPFYWLESEKTFEPLMIQLSQEWLMNYPNLHDNTIRTFFNILAKNIDKKDLTVIIEKQCEYYQRHDVDNSDDDIEKKRLFWYVRAFYYLESGYELYWAWLKQDKGNITVFQQLSSRWIHQDAPYFPALNAEKIELLLCTFIDKWKKVELPNSWGSDDPIEETAYRFLTEIIWKIEEDTPTKALPVIERLLADTRFNDFSESLKGMKATLLRKCALANFSPPSAIEVTAFFDNNQIITVESLRALIIEELQAYQADLNGGEFLLKDDFYELGGHIGEVPAVRKIADRLRLRLQGLVITTPEHHLHDDKRCDITCAMQKNGKRKLVTIEAKGQWHKELFSAVEEQLHNLYSIHPDAEGQGIYLVLWFGEQVKVANQTTHGIKSADELKQAIQEKIPEQFKGVTDVFVLDLSK